MVRPSRPEGWFVSLTSAQSEPPLSLGIHFFDREGPRKKGAGHEPGLWIFSRKLQMVFLGLIPFLLPYRTRPVLGMNPGVPLKETTSSKGSF